MLWIIMFEYQIRRKKNKDKEDFFKLSEDLLILLNIYDINLFKTSLKGKKDSEI